MKRRILNILTAGISTALSHSNPIYGIPNNDMLFVPRNRKRHTKTVAESKKCKSCKKFGTGQCYVRYITPLTAACENYQPKRKK